MNAAAFPSPTPPAQPATKDVPPTIASPPPFMFERRENAQTLPTRQPTAFYLSLLAMVAGLIVGLVFRYAGFRFFFESPFYMLYVAVLLAYGSLGVFFGYVRPQKGWKWGLWIIALAWLVEAFFTLPYLKLIIEVGMVWIPYAHLIFAPICACVGAYVGARLSRSRTSR
jgi:hypothetical protein